MTSSLVVILIVCTSVVVLISYVQVSPFFVDFILCNVLVEIEYTRALDITYRMNGIGGVWTSYFRVNV